MNELIHLLRQLDQSRFYGSVELKFEAGRLVTLKRTETLKPADLCRDIRGNHEQIKSS